MNYIDISEAVQATGKSTKTIRRLLAKIESKPFIEKKDGKIFVEVNYLFASYPSIKDVSKTNGQPMDIDQDRAMDSELVQLKTKIALYEQELRHKDELLNEKSCRIEDLQKSIFLLEAPKGESSKKKKAWWQF